MDKPNLPPHYYQKARLQLGLLWELSEDATLGTCSNLKLEYSPNLGTWVLFADGIEIDRFVIPFEDHSLQRFKRQCSAHYKTP